MISNEDIARIRSGEEVTITVPLDPMFKVWVNGATMVHGRGHLSEAKCAEWVETYRKINPDLPPGAIYVENTYF